MSIQIEHAAFDRVTALMADIQSALRTEHEQVSGEVTDLVGSSWGGQASEQFAEGWQQWCQGMRDVLGGITLQTSLISGYRAELDRTDGDRAAASALLGARLGEA